MSDFDDGTDERLVDKLRARMQACAEMLGYLVWRCSSYIPKDRQSHCNFRKDRSMWSLQCA